MPLAFTYNIESFDGDANSDGLFCLIYGIADGSLERFINLKTISSKFVTATYLKTLLKFKESLTAVELDFNKVSTEILNVSIQFNKFKCLTNSNLREIFHRLI
jgi:hypothetical protein